MDKKKNWLKSLKWLRSVVLIGGNFPLIFLGGSALLGNLGFNPVQTVMQRTGNLGMIFLILSLACTPINKIFKLPPVGRLRKPLGLFAALYAFLPSPLSFSE